MAEKKSLIAKFSLNTDTFNIIKAEYLGMRLARIAGITVPDVKLDHALGKDVLLVERFDRLYSGEASSRSLMLSGLSLLRLNELEARYASYCDLAEIIRLRFSNPRHDLLELYKRLVFNILIGNTDDHARNHSAFWDGKELNLTPAYDLCPQPRTGQEATQGMAIEGIEGNFSTLRNVQSISNYFHLTPEQAAVLINKMIHTIESQWRNVCEEADLSIPERSRLWRKSIFNPYCFQGWSENSF